MSLPQFLQCNGEFLGGRCDAVILHFDLDPLGRVKGTRDGLHVMTVYVEHVPAEGLPFVEDRFDLHDIVAAAVDLELIDIDNGAEIVQEVVARRHGCLPDLAFLRLSVAEEAVYAGGALVEPQPEGYSVCDGQALAQGPRRDLDAAEELGRRMSLEG